MAAITFALFLFFYYFSVKHDFCEVIKIDLF